MNILYILAILSLLVFTVSSILKERKYTKITRLISCGAAVVLSLVTAIAAPYLRAVSIGTAAVTVLSFGLSVLAARLGRDGVRRFVAYMAKAMLVVVLLEAVCFNFNCFHLWKGGYEKTAPDLNQAVVTGMTQTGSGYRSTGASATVEFPNLDQKVGTIRLDISGSLNKTEYTVDFADETNASYYLRTGLVSGTAFNEIEQTKTIVCDFSGKVSKLRINFTGPENNIVTLNGISLNEDYLSHFSILRFGLILLGIAFVWLFKRSVRFRAPLGDQLTVTKRVTAVVVIAAVAVSLLLSSVGLHPKTDFNGTSGNQITQELVDAFEAGQVSLKEQPGADLLNMENPYDWSARTEQGVNPKWDHVLYNGKYYSYYGVGPVILLYLPYHLITGHYLASLPGVVIFNTLALIFLGMTFYLLMKKLFKDIPLSMYTAALLMIYASCGVWYCTVMANFYEIAQSSGFCFTILGAYFLLSSNVIGDDGDALRPSSAALSSLFLAIAVTCRPTTAIWCVVAVAFIVAGVLKLRRTKSEKKAFIRYLLAALLPFVVIGGAQMLYNHARFGSFTDFGIAYSLTINDFTHTEFHTQLSAIGFFDYLLAPPSFSGQFPYVQTTLSKLGVNGYYFEATNNGAGLLYRALPTFFLFGAPFALKFIEKEKRVRTAVLFSAVAFVAPFIIIASIWESGYGTRYMMDFAWQMLACAFLVMFLYYRQLKSGESKRIYEHLMLIALFACLFVNMGLVYAYWYPGPYTTGAETAFVSFGRMFSMFNT
ncbi:hypothetical protein [Ruminococcus sp.]|uniref:hypothetical protein n=1 Tax=Ruminococcus sp. TaxID=41978 RepID=UPI00388E719C